MRPFFVAKATTREIQLNPLTNFHHQSDLRKSEAVVGYDKGS